MSITKKLLILFFIVGVSVLSIVGPYSYYKAKEALLDRTLAQLTSIRVIKKEQIELFYNERFKNLYSLSIRDFIKNLIEKLSDDANQTSNISLETKLQFQKFHEKIPFRKYGFSNVYLITQNKNHEKLYYTVQDSILMPFREQSVIKSLLDVHWEKSVSADSEYVTDFTRKNIYNTEPVCLISRRVTNQDDRFCGIMVLEIPIRVVNDILNNDSKKNGLGNTGEIYLVGSDTLMRNNSRFINNSVLRTKVKMISFYNAIKNNTDISISNDYRGELSLCSSEMIHIKNLHWVIIAEIDLVEAMLPIAAIRNNIGIMFLLICIFLFLVAYFISTTITKPIILLKNATLNIGDGDFNVSIKPSSNDEIGLLSQSFNLMSKHLLEERKKRMSALYDGQEMERQRFSRELHDNLGQKMFAIKLLLESTSGQDFTEVQKAIEIVKKDFSKAMEDVREISDNLSPKIFSESGIDTALKKLCDSIKFSANTNIEFSAHGDFNTDNLKIKIYIFRIAQEALNNAVKHSGAENIQVQLIGNTDSIILRIEDNGKGFIFDDNFENKGTGMYNMKERAHLIDANLNIETGIGEGTTIRLKIRKNK